MSFLYYVQLAVRKAWFNLVLVNVTELIKRECIKSSFCGIFISLKRPFSNAEHKTLLEKLGLYGIQERGETFFSKKEDTRETRGYSFKTLQLLF